MSNSRIRELLDELHREVQTTDVNDDTRALIQSLDGEVHQLLNRYAEQDDSNAVLEQAKALEARFAASHPAADKFMRDVIDTLARIGV